MSLTCVEDFATVVFGAGSGFQMKEALKRMIAGFFNGMRDVDEHRRVHTITLCEFDADRYRELRQELLNLSLTPLFDQVEVTVDELTLESFHPAQDIAHRGISAGVDPVYLIVRAQRADVYQASLLTADGKATIVTADIEVNRKILHKHLGSVMNTGFSEFHAYGAKLAELVLPETIRRLLLTMTDRPVVVIHDLEASRIPWEALRIGSRDLAMAGLSRKLEARDLSIAKWLHQRQIDEKLTLLLIINPTQDLPGAENEGRRMREILHKFPAAVIEELRGPTATRTAVRAAFESGRYDIIHYAGHAYFDPEDLGSSGIVCAGNEVVNGADLATSSSLPALLMFNACESGRVRKLTRGKLQVENTDRRGLLAANAGLAETLLRGGMANYVGTYWPVTDIAASAFAEAFYTKLMQGYCIGDALVAGRSAIRALGSIDWADYIHYGSWRFRVKARNNGFYSAVGGARVGCGSR
jgi:CHAT domain-containing protein